MSRYYACADCGHQFTLAEGEKPPEDQSRCPECGGTVREVGARVDEVKGQATVNRPTIVTDNAKDAPQPEG